MNTRARSTRRAKEAASNFVKRIASGRNASSPSPERGTKVSRQKASKPKEVQGKTVVQSSGKAGTPVKEATTKGTSQKDAKKINANQSKSLKPCDSEHDTPEKQTTKNSTNQDKKSKGVDGVGKSKVVECDGEEDSSTVTIVPQYVSSPRKSFKDGESGSETPVKENDEEEKTDKEGSPQVLLSPTTKYIKGKSGEKSQIFKLSLAPGSEGQLIQAGGTVKIGSTLLKITPKSNIDVFAKKTSSGRRSRSKSNKNDDDDGDNQSGDKSVKSHEDQEEYASSLDTSIDEFEILDQSIEVDDEDDEDVSYPSVQQDTFFSAFGLVKKSELPKDGDANKLHRLAGGKLRRVLKPNFAPGMVYKDGKIIIDDATESSPRSRNKVVKISAKPTSAVQKLNFQEAAQSSPTSSPKPVKREWLKPPPKRAKSSPEAGSKTSATSAQSSPSSKAKGGKEGSEVKLKKHNSFPREKTEKNNKKAGGISKAKSNDDIDLSLLPYRRSTRQRETKRKEWKHLLRACPDEFEKDPQWDQELQKRKQRSEIRMNKKLERMEKKTEENKDEKKEKSTD